MTKETGQGFIKAPRNIVFSRALNANCKIILLQLIDRYNYLKSKGKLPDDDYFYMIGADFESQTGLTAQTIQRNIIPVLVEQGFITKLDRAKRDDAHYKTYSYFKLDWDAINNHDGAIKKTTQRTRARKADAAQEQEPAREQPQSMDMKEELDNLIDRLAYNSIYKIENPTYKEDKNRAMGILCFQGESNPFPRLNSLIGERERYYEKQRCDENRRRVRGLS